MGAAGRSRSLWFLKKKSRILRCVRDADHLRIGTIKGGRQQCARLGSFVVATQPSPGASIERFMRCLRSNPAFHILRVPLISIYALTWAFDDEDSVRRSA